MITIKDVNGNALLSLERTDGSMRVFTLMQEDYVSLKFTLTNPIIFGIGSYIELDDFGRFEIVDIQKPNRSQQTKGWEYELRFEKEYRKLKNKIFKFNPENQASETSWNLTADLQTHASVILSNIEELGYDFNGVPYSVSIDQTIVEQPKPITYDSVSILDAISMVAEAWETEWWFEDSVIHFGRCEFGDPAVFDVADNVASMEADGNGALYATRLYAFGSPNNLPADYRNDENNIVVNGIAQKRLMLPIETPYVDADPNLQTDEIVEAVAVFDEYPKIDSQVASVSTIEYDEVDENGNATGQKWNAYRYTDSSLTFKEEYILEGEELKVLFESGLLAGMTFNVKFNPDGESETDIASQVFEIIRSEDYGRPLPDSTLHPAVGDKVVLIGWDTSKIESLGLVAAAEQRLLTLAREELAKISIEPTSYKCTMVSSRLFVGNTPTLYSLGDRVRLVNAGMFAQDRISRIIGYEYDLAQPWNSPVYIVGEQAESRRLSELEAKVESLSNATKASIGGNTIYVIRTIDSTPPSDSNVYSAKRSRLEFLSRTKADTAFGKIAFADGLESQRKATFQREVQFGSAFVGGMQGIGGQIDSSAHAELESLTLRSWLEVPEIRYNRAEVILGDQWRAPGGGIVESVSVDLDAGGNPLMTGTITLKLEDGEIGAIAEDDICKGYFHDFGNPANNASADTDDSRGNTTFSGFCTIFFRVGSIIGSDGVNKTFRYVLRPTSERWPHSFHPFAGMHFVAYGNFTRADRQKSAYETRTYARHLVGVSDWEFGEANIAMQMGDLSNLSVFGLQMAGYSAYLNNIYMTGVIRQTDPAILPRIEVETDSGDNFVPAGGTLTLTCKAYKGWEALSATSWTITRDSGNPAADATWNAAHTSFSGTITLSHADIGATAYSSSSLFSVTAQGSNWSATKTLALHTLAQTGVQYVDEGAWSALGDYKHERLISDPASPWFGAVVTSDVWHAGCKYRCLADGTSQAPRWNSSDWAFLEGNPDFAVGFTNFSDADRFDFDRFSLDLNVAATLYNQDISDDTQAGLPCITYDWSRMIVDAQGNELVNSDSAWTSAHQNYGRSISLTKADIGLSEIPRLLRFTCTATLNGGAQAIATFDLTD